MLNDNALADLDGGLLQLMGSQFAYEDLISFEVEKYQYKFLRDETLNIEYYDRKNDLLKTLEFKQYKKYKGKYWRAHEQIMTNHHNGKTTLISTSDFKFNTGLKSRDFNKTALIRMR